MHELGRFLIAFFIIGAVFSILERLFPSIPGQRSWRPGIRTDLIYWIMQPLVFKPLTRGAMIVFVVFLALLAGVTPQREALQHWVTQGHGPLARLPAGLQALLALALIDFTNYWTHRIFHAKPFWRIHAVHHSSVQLDWLASVRVHPINEIVGNLMPLIPLLLLGVRLDVLGGVAPIFTLYAILLHANVSWTYGPFRYLIASPAFHRWHHTAQEEGLDKNFAGLFPLWDLLFGTFYMPKDRAPTKFGVISEKVPEGFWKQLVWPLSRS